MGKTHRRRANKHANMFVANKQRMRRCKLGPFYGRPRLAWWENNEWYDCQKEKQQENELMTLEKLQCTCHSYLFGDSGCPCKLHSCQMMEEETMTRLCTCNSYGDWWDCLLHDPAYQHYRHLNLNVPLVFCTAIPEKSNESKKYCSRIRE